MLLQVHVVLIYYSCKGVRQMTYSEYIAKCEVAKTVFQCGVTAALVVEVATLEQRLAWIAEDLKKLETDLAKIDKAFDEQDEVGDPFVDSVKEEVK
jgi:hypothetical protein